MDDIEKLQFEKELENNLYLRKVALNEIKGEVTGIPNLDKPWLKYYKETQIKQMPIEKTAYRYLYDENKKFEHDIAIVYLGKKIKYYELFNQIENVAKSLKQIGVSKGEVVTICMPNTPESAYLFYACSKIGAIADFIDPRENEDGLEKYLNISNPKHLVLLDLCFDKFKQLIKEKQINNVILTNPLESLPYPIMCSAIFKEKISNFERYKSRRVYIEKSNSKIMSYRDFIKNGKKYSKETEEDYQKDTPVAIVHTGGTTGIPKGVLLSNDNLNELTSQIKNSDLQFIRNYLLMGVMPEFVGYGLSVGLHTSLVCGMKTMMIPKYEPEKIPKLILKYKPNCIAGSPAHWEIISKSRLINKDNVDLSFLKAPIEGGDTLNIKVENKVNEILKKSGCKYKIIKGYGMTEKCSAATVCSTNEMNELGCVGAPFTKTVISIFDNEKECDLKYDQVGEICISAPDIMLEYYNNKEETDKVIKYHSDGKKWLHSGDLGYMTKNGILYVVGRIKDIIIRYDGIKIYPYNIESILLKHPAVKSIAIIGKKDPNHLNGEIPVAFLTIDEKYNQKNVINDIKQYAFSRVVDYAIPVEFNIMDNLPKTQVGKVNKKELKEKIQHSKQLVLKNNK